MCDSVDYGDAYDAAYGRDPRCDWELNGDGVPELRCDLRTPLRCRCRTSPCSCRRARSRAPLCPRCNASPCACSATRCRCGSFSCDGSCRNSEPDGCKKCGSRFCDGSCSPRCECGARDCDGRCDGRGFCTARFCARRSSAFCPVHCAAHCSVTCGRRAAGDADGGDCGLYRAPVDNRGCGQCRQPLDNCDCDESASRDDRAVVGSCARGAGIARRAPTHSGGAVAWGGALTRATEASFVAREDEHDSLHGAHIPIGFARYRSPVLNISDYEYVRVGQWRVAVPFALGLAGADTLIARILAHGPQAAGYIRMGDTLVPDALEPSDRAALAGSAPARQYGAQFRG